MRNILITVMMLIVTALLFTSIVGGNGGLRSHIQTHGNTANANISALLP